MPHWSGLLMPDELTQKASAYSSQTLGDQINYYIGLIKPMQDRGVTQRFIELNDVVDINVERFFRLQLTYTVTHTPQGGGQTLITRITW